MSQPQPTALRVAQISQYILFAVFLIVIAFIFFVLFTDSSSKELQGLAIDSQDNIYISSEENYTIRKYDTQGNLLTTWGSKGSADGQFGEHLGPGKIAAGPDNEIYILDRGNFRIQKFDQNGKFLAKWGSQGKGPGQFDSPQEIAVDSQGQVYVWDGKEAQKYNRDGNFLGILGDNLPEKEYFSGWRNLEVDSADNVYVYSGNLRKIFVFAPNGQLLKSVAIQGLDLNQDDDFGDLAMDHQSNFYLNDTYNPQMLKFDPAGKFLLRWPLEGEINNYSHYEGTAIDSRNNVYALNSVEDRVEIFDSNGHTLKQFSIGWPHWLRNSVSPFMLIFCFANLSLGILVNELKKKYGLLKTPRTVLGIIKAPTIAGKISQNLTLCALFPLFITLLIVKFSPVGLTSAWVISTGSETGNTILILAVLLIGCAVAVAVFFVPRRPLLAGFFLAAGGITIYFLTSGLILKVLAIAIVIGGALAIVSAFEKNQAVPLDPKIPQG